MSPHTPPESLAQPLSRLAGYLNFSAGSGNRGRSDVATLKAWNEVFETATAGDPMTGMPAWLIVKDWLTETLDQLSKENSAFSDCRQAKGIIRLLWSELLPYYLDFHRDLLFHQEPELLFNGFFIARAADVLLGCAPTPDLPSASSEEVIRTVVDQLDDFVGYRPVSMLENRACQPYRNEFVCPVPLYFKDAGVSAGPYQEILEEALRVLQATDPDILRAASFDLDRMIELSLDPRAYDFDHPVNRRPNYHFGGWDERSITGDGFYDRFIVRAVTLDALLGRFKQEHDLDRREALVEAGTVLAGTILMSSGITGWGPSAYTSDITLGSLMKPIAAYRDAFYDDCLNRITGNHGERLRTERDRRHQPFGGVRQHLNAALARRRAAQLQHVQLARLYARMGYPDAAKHQLDTVPAASARMVSRIDCAMTLGLRRLREGKLEQAAEVPQVAFDLLKRAIECGSVIDPWEILGASGNFSLYSGTDSSVHDQRVDDLIYLIEQLFGYIARVWSEAAARDDEACYQQMESCYREIAQWWREFAVHTLDSIEAADPLESYESANLVARALRLWHRGGAEAGDVAFWAPHADLFDSPRAYALVITALLDRKDFVPSMALLVHWLSNADRVGLRLGGTSLPRLSERWLLRLRRSTELTDTYGEPSIDQVEPSDARDVWPLARKFFDYLEANAEEFWSAPRFRLGESHSIARDWDLELSGADDDDGEEENLYSAAYDGMVYHDTTDDGNEGATFDPEAESRGDELEAEAKRLIDHLSFLQSLARMWSVAADLTVADQNPDDWDDRWHSLQSWAARAKENRIGLLELLGAVQAYPIAPAGSDKESMRAYDRRRVQRDSLMERIINTAVEMSDARRLISGAMMSLAQLTAKDHQTDETLGGQKASTDHDLPEDDAGTIRIFGAVIAGDVQEARKQFAVFLSAISDKSLLYIPISRGGDPVKIYVARLRQRALRHLMHWLPRRGLLAETCRLIDMAREMEQQNPIGAGAVTEFDGLFQAGFRSLVASVVESTQSESQTIAQSDMQVQAHAENLIALLEQLTEILLASWLSHSQTLRLSQLETVTAPKKWEQLVDFIKKYGDPVFTQTFLQLGNVRAILHQGVGDWIQRAMEQGDEQFRETRLFQDLENGTLRISKAERWITLVYESLIDHHAEYLDYNSTTTQSDRGDLVYMFLDFLRLRVRYERIVWNLKPVMWVHEVLVRGSLDKAAMMWRRSLSQRIGEEAELYVQRLEELQANYAMRMPTVADRINERFVQPMTIDRMRALMGPAMRDAEAGQPSHAFNILEQEAELLTRNPTGVGLDVPAWLDSLEEEVEQLAKRQASSEIDPHSLMTVAILPMKVSELAEQLETARSQGRRLPHLK